jgi:hypothetical protein
MHAEAGVPIANAPRARRPSLDIRPAIVFTISSTDRVKALYDSGFKAATDFLAKWEFQAYIEEYRRGREHHRAGTVMPA